MEIQIANTVVYCAKWKETVDFYKNQLQLRVTTDLDWFVEFELTATARLSIADVTRTSQEACRGLGITLAMEVEDIVAAHVFLETAGLYPPIIRDHAWDAHVFYIHDPEGNRLEFWSPKKKSGEITETTAIREGEK
jgi:catechol 2,3-dioxygenase-like lactoylglutathione lyase family enzyme